MLRVLEQILQGALHRNGLGFGSELKGAGALLLPVGVGQEVLGKAQLQWTLIFSLLLDQQECRCHLVDGRRPSLMPLQPA